MAAPTFVAWQLAQTVITTGTGTPSLGGVSAGDIIILQVVRDGTASAVTLVDTNSTIEDLAGTDNTMTVLAATQPVGSPTAAAQFLWIGRALSTTVSADVSTAGDDLYCLLWAFRDVNAGTTLAAVIENGTAGSFANGAGTSITIADTAVTTLGADRMALNFVGINDDATGYPGFSGASGGTWALRGAAESATGTDATNACESADMAAAGTIDGATQTITSDGWGVVGFALIGTTVAAAASDPTSWINERRTPRRRSMQRW